MAGMFIFQEYKMNMKEKIQQYLDSNNIAKQDLSMRIGILLGFSFELALQMIQNKEQFLNQFQDINTLKELKKTINIFYSSIKVDDYQTVFKSLIEKELNKLSNFNNASFYTGIFIAKDFIDNILI